MVRCTEGPDGRRAGFAGLATCGSVWACPVCAAKIAAEHAADLGAVLKAADAQGLRTALVTLTVRHHKGDSLAKVWNAVTQGWSRVTSGKGWKTDQERYGIAGWARAVETTEGDINGWHVHVHAVACYSGSEADGLMLGARMWNRWDRGVQAAGMTSVRDSGGLDVQISKGGDLGKLGAYLAKAGADLDGLAREATMGAAKQGKGSGHRTPFQIARDFLDTGDLDDLALWHEWERTSKGRRQLTWSKGMRELADLGDERTDEEIAADETGTADDDVLLLPGETWAAVRRTSWLILDVVEQHGRDGLVLLLEHRRLAWAEPPSRT